jgi:hypothetical protein
MAGMGSWMLTRSTFDRSRLLSVKVLKVKADICNAGDGCFRHQETKKHNADFGKRRDMFEGILEKRETQEARHVVA